MDDRPFAGRAALVTGGARRIGATLAKRLAALGCDVAIHHHTSRSEAVQLAARLRAQGGKAAAVAADLSSPPKAAHLVDAAARALGRPLDLLVNSASPFPKARLEGLSWGGLEETLRVTAWAPFELTRALAAQLPPKRPGAVVNVLDARIADADRDHAGYHLAKRMLADLTRLSAAAYAPRVTVNAVAPGAVLAPAGDPGLLERVKRHLPLQRTASPDDLADAVLYLLGARSVTGQILFVDAGRHLGRAAAGPAPAARRSPPAG